MTEQQIYDGITEILREVFDDDRLVATPELSARDVPEWDSFNQINVVVASELKFGVQFRSAEIEALNCVGDFAALIRSKLDAN
ncbi:acyl carrier protein [Arenibaculum sp.]|jgi:acyl carrier protein|uniref:acyl carrier protein n=1 Tax=Arenibaculum sp. TaxID=2865862 RepID=UPI002E10E9E6|nr:acyl carrier protein [Arenibaculum sp.]